MTSRRDLPRESAAFAEPGGVQISTVKVPVVTSTLMAFKR
jgi:hypothetical protein